MILSIGDKVTLIDDDIIGEITKIGIHSVWILTEDGFEMEFLKNNIIVLNQDQEIVIDPIILEEVLKEKDQKKEKKVAAKKKKKSPPLEIDLHIEKLAYSIKNMSKFDMLNLQLETAKNNLEFAIKNNIQKVIFIHGVGEGVLKAELLYLLKKYNNIAYYDANYNTYGLGATEVIIYQNNGK